MFVWNFDQIGGIDISWYYVRKAKYPILRMNIELMKILSIPNMFTNIGNFLEKQWNDSFFFIYGTTFTRPTDKPIYIN